MLIDRIRTCLQHNEAEWMTRSEIAQCLDRNRNLMYPRDIDLLNELVGKLEVEKGYVRGTDPSGGYKYRYNPKPIKDVILKIICDAETPLSLGDIVSTLKDFYNRDFGNGDLSKLKKLEEQGYVKIEGDKYACNK